MRGYFGIGIENGKTSANVGVLWRSAHVFGASFLFTVGGRYQKQCSDTTKAWRHVPLFYYASIDELVAPHECEIVGIELHERAETLRRFRHPERAIYLLGAEDSGLSDAALAKCDRIIQLPGRFCLNVAIAGSIVLHHRFAIEHEAVA